MYMYMALGISPPWFVYKCYVSVLEDPLGRIIIIQIAEGRWASNLEGSKSPRVVKTAEHTYIGPHSLGSTPIFQDFELHPPPQIKKAYPPIKICFHYTNLYLNTPSPGTHCKSLYRKKIEDRTPTP